MIAFLTNWTNWISILVAALFLGLLGGCTGGGALKDAKFKGVYDPGFRITAAHSLTVSFNLAKETAAPLLDLRGDVDQWWEPKDKDGETPPDDE